MDQTDEMLSKTLIRADFWKAHHATGLNTRQHKIISMLLDDFFGKLQVAKYAKITQTLTDIQDLMKKGILEQEGSGRSTSYRIKL